MSGRGDFSKVGMAAKIRMSWNAAPDDADEDQVLQVAMAAQQQESHPRDVWAEVNADE